MTVADSRVNERLLNIYIYLYMYESKKIELHVGKM
jgi:hypothetical protein